MVPRLPISMLVTSAGLAGSDTSKSESLTPWYHAPRPLKRLYRRREESMVTLRSAFEAARRGEGISKRAPVEYHGKLREDGTSRKRHGGLRTHSSFGKSGRG